MKFLIDTRSGETITATLADCSQPYSFVDRIDCDVDAETFSCVLSTARSLEAEAVKETSALFSRLLIDGNSNIGWGLMEEMNAWLEKWDAK